MTADDRLTLIARINALIAVRDRLVTALLRTGADPEWVAERACTDTWAGTETTCPPLPFTGRPCTNPEPLPHDYCWSSGCYVADKHDTNEKEATA
jgi:hypothetical protein